MKLLRILKQKPDKFNLIRKITTSNTKSEPKEFKSIPGPKSYPLVENLFSLKKYGGHLDPKLPDLLFELQKRYGNLVKLGIARKPEVNRIRNSYAKL